MLNLDHPGGEMREMRRLIPPGWSRFSISPPDGLDSDS